MDHLAIMKKSWGLIPKIIDGTKTIESRWYLKKHLPWGKIKKGDNLYFKNSGEKVSVRISVKGVKQFENLTPAKVKKTLEKYGQKDGLGISDLSKFYRMFKDKKYCILVFLKNPQKVKPFNIDKSDFGAMSAWISVKNIKEIKVQDNL